MHLSSCESFTDIQPFHLEKIRKSNLIKIPSKLQHIVDNYISKKDLHSIDLDIEVAKESIYLVASNIMHFSDNHSFKIINQEFLVKLITGCEVHTLTNFKKVKTILHILSKGTSKNGPIIECDNHYKPGIKSKGYRFTLPYYNKGIRTYELKNKKIIEIKHKSNSKLMREALNNTITKNLIFAYQKVVLPTDKEILKEAKRLIKENFKTKKGKLLAFKGRTSEANLDKTKFSYIEDSINLFHYLVDDGFMIPIIGDEKSGGRVVDSFVLMPSWIRNLCSIDTSKFVELDYQALHPNIAISLYDGHIQNLKHSDIATELNMDISSIKKEHLSFFNMKPYMMKNCNVWNFYETYELEMLTNILAEKQLSEK